MTHHGASVGVSRIRRLIDDGKVDDPAIVSFVQSLEERLEAGRIDEITVAQLGRLAELCEDLLSPVSSPVRMRPADGS